MSIWPCRGFMHEGLVSTGLLNRFCLRKLAKSSLKASPRRTYAPAPAPSVRRAKREKTRPVVVVSEKAGREQIMSRDLFTFLLAAEYGHELNRAEVTLDMPVPSGVWPSKAVKILGELSNRAAMYSSPKRFSPEELKDLCDRHHISFSELGRLARIFSKGGDVHVESTSIHNDLFSICETLEQALFDAQDLETTLHRVLTQAKARRRSKPGDDQLQRRLHTLENEGDPRAFAVLGDLAKDRREIDNAITLFKKAVEGRSKIPRPLKRDHTPDKLWMKISSLEVDRRDIKKALKAVKMAAWYAWDNEEYCDEIVKADKSYRQWWWRTRRMLARMMFEFRKRRTLIKHSYWSFYRRFFNVY